MSLPICIEIPELPDPISITLPGGVSMESINLLEQLQPALAPLVPLFNIVDTVVALFNCIKAIPEVIGPPPDPTILAACIPELAEKVNALLKLIPQLSLPEKRSRQWVLTFPRPLHTYLAYFPHALTDALDLFIETLRYHYQRRCLPLAPHPPEHYDVDHINACYRPRHPHDLGALTSIQRHTDALSLYPHLHTITTDGLFVTRGDSSDPDSTLKPRAPVEDVDFIPAEHLSNDDLKDILVLYQHRLTRRKRSRSQSLFGLNRARVVDTLNRALNENQALEGISESA